MNHPPPNQMWPDVYEHCHRCEKIKQKVDMAAVDGCHVCVECVSAIFANEREIEDLRTAMELLAVEVAWRRKVGYCPNEVFENVSNNQTCRTALTDAGCSPVAMQDRKDTIIAALQAEVKAWREQLAVFQSTFPGQPERYAAVLKVNEMRKATDSANALEKQ